MKLSFRTDWLKKYWMLERRRATPRNRSILGLELLECRTVPALLDVSSGIITFSVRTSFNDNVSVSQVNNTFTVIDSANPITLSANAISAGWTNEGTNAVVGPSLGISLLNLSLGTGNNTIESATGGAANVTIEDPGVLDVAGLVSSTNSISITGLTSLTDTTGAGILQGSAITLSASNGIGTAGKNIIVSGASPTVNANSISNGVYITSLDGVNISASAAGTSNVSVTNTAGTLNVTSQGIDASGTIAGNLSLSSTGPVTLNGNIGSSSFSGTIALQADRNTANGNFYEVNTTTGTLSFSSNSGTSWTLEDRLVSGLQGGSNGAVTPIDWFDNLADPTLAALARADYTRDQSITRDDFIGLLTEVYNSGPTVTAAQLNSLQTLVNYSSSLNVPLMPAYVDNLASKLVNGNRANSYYQDETVYDSPTLGSVTLGNLTPNCSTKLLQLLTDKWFLGEDEPLASGPYEKPQGVLFATSTGVPSPHDVAQGSIADCYFLSALGQLALQSPSTIENMFINNGDGTYTVRFFNNGVPDYVTIDSLLPVTTKSGGTFIYAGYYQYGDNRTYTNANNVLWVAYAEKAYAQLAEEGWSRPNYVDPTTNAVVNDSVNAYSSLNDGKQLEGNVWEQILGVTNSSLTRYSVSGYTIPAFEEIAILNAINQGQLVGFHTDDNFPTSNTLNTIPSNPGFISDHSYILESYNPNAANNLDFTFLNPYDDGTGQRTVSATWQQVEAFFHYIDVVTPPMNIMPVPSSPK